MTSFHVLHRRVSHAGIARLAGRSALRGALVAVLLLAHPAARAGSPPVAAPADLQALDRALDWSAAKLIAIQDGGRYRTLDSFARESLQAMTGRESLPGLSPLASLLELTFNRDAYADVPLIYIRDKGIRIHLSTQLGDEARRRIRETGYATLRDLYDPRLLQRLQELEPRFEMNKAVGRVRHAEAVAKFCDRLLRIVPRPGHDANETWLNPRELTPSLPADVLTGFGQSPERIAREIGPPVPGIDARHAVAVLAPWASLQGGWLKRDREGVQRSLDRLAETLPTLADAGVYPSAAQRRAELLYYSSDKMTWGYAIYLVGTLFGVAALVTRWRWLWWTSMGWLVLAAGLHAFGIALRWYILGRIPVANMFEAVTAGAWVAVVVGILAEFLTRSRLFLVGGGVTGFFALALADQALPGSLNTMMGILDSVMLRIHTTLIISSYGAIFLASVIALIYLFGYYLHFHAARSAETGLLTALLGLLLVGLSYTSFRESAHTAAGVTHLPAVRAAFGATAAMLAGVLVFMLSKRARGLALVMLVLLLTGSVVGAVGAQPFVWGVGLTFLAGGLAWAGATAVGIALRSRSRAPAPAFSVVAGGSSAVLSGGGAGGAVEYAREVGSSRPCPRPECGFRNRSEASNCARCGAPLPNLPRPEPAWLRQMDWCHLIILNMVFVMLFIGVILGAVWADFSWGRPWNWDPKEVFAMNTWIIYAILIHTRFIVSQKGLWTAWLSVLGCLMMAFNWCFVNFFIVGLHSYA
jgi:ABC-type transport system involved in cytochrome c biogenesis permease subunit